MGGNEKPYDLVIIGSGIAGSALAFELEKKKKEGKQINYLVLTDQISSLTNTSSLSFGHCRIPRSDNLEMIVNESVEKLGEDRDKMKFVYSNSKFVLDFLYELGVDFEQRSFGIIPLGTKPGGRLILEKLQEKIYSFETETELLRFSKISEGFKLNLKQQGKRINLKTKNLVLATGGYAGKFKHNDNFTYQNYDIFENVKRNGGEIIHTDSIFMHPFGYHNGKSILIGIETQEGEFIDSNNNLIFNEKTRALIKDNNYHEIFNNILNQIENYRERKQQVYFVNGKRKIEILPTVHYTPGGIKTDYLGSVVGCDGLYAIGEVRADGFKNGGRFPGYPFTAAIVNGKFLADHLSQNFINQERLNK